jgi:hypothetical protein
MQWSGRLKLVTGVLAIAIAGCGGGGGGGSAEIQTQAAADDSSRALVMLGVGAIHSIAGVQLLLEQASAFAVIEGAVGGSAIGQCTGGGTVQVQKQSTTGATLRAANCKPRTNAPLVYDGTWTFTITSNTTGSGVCPGPGCELEAALAVNGARFGYGTATEPVLGRNYRSQINSQGRSAGAYAAGETIVDGGVTASFSGPAELLTMTLGGVSVQLNANLARGTLFLSGPGYININFGGANVVADLDMDKNNVIERSLVIPWSEFLN